MTDWNLRQPDRRDGDAYVASADLKLAVDVALATGRPLLVRGEPGSGKSSLAPYVARTRGWRYYEHVVTSRTQATDLLWTFDSVRRLADAQTLPPGGRLDDFRYVGPGVLWWAFAPVSAARRGRLVRGRAGHGRQPMLGQHSAADPFSHTNRQRSPDHAVVLIDEIDKADPDMPNSLLVPLGSSEFLVTETGTLVRKEPPSPGTDATASRHLVVVTTNEERALPQAFLRRCVIFALPEPTRDWLIAVARDHVLTSGGEFAGRVEKLAEELADELIKTRKAPDRQAARPPSTAEYLDALRACIGLEVSVDSQEWLLIRKLTLAKQDAGTVP